MDRPVLDALPTSLTHLLQLLRAILADVHIHSIIGQVDSFVDAINNRIIILEVDLFVP